MKDADEKDAQMKWEYNYCFPFAIKVIDCTHIKIKKTTHQSDEYICRKGFHSINVQATCYGKELFTGVDISWPGLVHDSNTVCQETVYTLKINTLFHFPQQNFLWLRNMPLANDTNPEPNNKVFTRERVTIERCFGQLKQRFSIIQLKIRIYIYFVFSAFLYFYV
ncbi:putative nuclease HARBI1 [Zeugodacus cucurbitae]|uniref:putative nuclease HARBI1 n=1 Tax=Zeugodacus cucurbitae TaxID=28588 RepID=UPI0023D92F9F|nr:putative nuclease HARBI1 [Zeugodacus cucurbitae]